ncbi:MAG: carboxypeptidase regulatory-like domain-containing protein, partial [Candidatus Acidiferrum sp.]
MLNIDSRPTRLPRCWLGFAVVVTIAVFAAQLLLAPGAAAQTTATLSGTVTDATGAVLAGAQITITEQRSGVERKVVTNHDGYFSAPTLSVGVYKLTVSAQGFAAYEITDIALNSADSKSLMVAMKLATVSATVEVSAAATEIVTVDSGDKSSVLTSIDLQQTALASRNAAEIVKIMDGASLTANGGINRPNTTPTIGINGYTVGGNAAGLGGTQINGQSLDVTLDGGHVFDPGAAGSATPVNLNVDMISEVKVLASNFSAEYEKGPVVINAETKGGGNRYHGQLHFIGQNAALNSTDASVKLRQQPKGASSAYYPGGQLGGPIPLGKFNKNHDKFFFFDGFEAYRQNVDGLLAFADVPTAAMLGGDFSSSALAGLRTWPLNSAAAFQKNADGTMAWEPWQSARNVGQPGGCNITGGVLTSACIDPNGLALLKGYLPAPNADPAKNAGWNYVQPINADQNSWQNVTREDWNISDSTKAYVRYSVQRETSNQPLGLWGNSGGNNIVVSPTPEIGAYASDSVSTSLMHMFSPSMTSETTFMYTFEGMPNHPKDWAKLSRAGMGLSLTGVYGNQQAPSFTSWGGGLPTLAASNGVGENFSPVQGVRATPGMMANKGMPSVRENFTKVLGTHTLKAGAYWERIYNKQDNWGQYMGVFQDAEGWGTGVGNPYADILMGVTDGQFTEQQLPPQTQISQNLVEFYATDHWRINRRLSIDYGMRFDHFGKPYSDNNLGLAIFDPSKYSNDPAQVDAHTGVLWHGIDSSLPLSGTNNSLLFYSPRFGLAWDIFGSGKTVLRGGWGLYRAYDSLQSNSYTGPAQVAMGAASYYCNAWACPTFEDIDKAAINHPLPAGLPPGKLGVNVMDPKNHEQPLLTTYSMSIDQRLPGKFLLEASYVGNHGANQQPQIDVNAVPMGAVPQSYLVACNKAGNCNYDPYRPRTNYLAITEALTLGGSQYDALQVSLHRSVGWLSLLANYAWSKTYAVGDFNSSGNSGGWADRGLHEYWGVSAQDRPHVFNASYTFTIPNPKWNSAFMRGLGTGWQISGITTIQSGANETAQNYGLNYAQDDNAGAGIFNSAVGHLGTPGIAMHPSIICDPRMHQQVTLPDGTTGMRFLNPACFAPAAPGTAGTTNMPYLPGPRYINSDLSLAKTTSLTERQQLQFRVQMFNFLNHPLWSFNTNDGNLNAKFNADGTMKTSNINGVAFNTFGIAEQKFGHRLIELSVR